MSTPTESNSVGVFVLLPAVLDGSEAAESPWGVHLTSTDMQRTYWMVTGFAAMIAVLMGVTLAAGDLWASV